MRNDSTKSKSTGETQNQFPARSGRARPALVCGVAASALILGTLGLAMLGMRNSREASNKASLAELNDLKEVGLAWMTFCDLQGRGPKDPEDLIERVEVSPSVQRGLRDKRYVMFWGANTSPAAGFKNFPEGASDTLIGNSTEIRAGARWVVLGDGTVRRLNEQEFARAPRPVLK